MVISEIIGNRADVPLDGLSIELLQLEWFETAKRIQRKMTTGGMEIAIRFLKEGQCLRQGDIIYKDEEKAVIVDIMPCEAIVISPASMLQMGRICYEIGNKHLPAFIQEDQVLVPYEEPLFRWLEASEFKPEKEKRQLLNILKSNVEPHGYGHAHGGSSLFSKIMGLGK